MRRRLKGRRKNRLTKKIQLVLDLLKDTAERYDRNPNDFDILIKITGEIETIDRKTADSRILRLYKDACHR